MITGHIVVTDDEGRTATFEVPLRLDADMTKRVIEEALSVSVITLAWQFEADMEMPAGEYAVGEAERQRDSFGRMT